MKIAIVGGIGSGKSEVLRVANSLGFDTLSADEINKELLLSPSYINKIAKSFPSAVVDGKVDKTILSKIVFSDNDKRLLLNSIAHPEIASKIKENKSDNLVVELPLALESGVIDIFDKVVLIDTDVQLRLNRLELRGVEKGRAQQIIDAQVPISELKKVATDVIVNDGSLSELVKQATLLFEKLK